MSSDQIISFLRGGYDNSIYEGPFIIKLNIDQKIFQLVRKIYKKSNIENGVFSGEVIKEINFTISKEICRDILDSGIFIFHDTYSDSGSIYRLNPTINHSSFTNNSIDILSMIIRDIKIDNII